MQKKEKMCLPIIVPSDDYFYSKYNITCLNRQVRSNVTLTGCCQGIPMEQVPIIK